ncbi:MAG: hypothetical protein GX815_06090 [Clostridiales bacterium]|nr:hypothetical protein [Clostridiales bacterium]
MSNQYPDCSKETIVSQIVKAQAQITVNPIVKHGRPKVYCLESNIRPCKQSKKVNYWTPPEDRCKKPSNNCTFTLTQLLCVEIPIEFGVDVDVNTGITRCGTAKIGPCEPRCNSRQEEFYFEQGIWKLR